MSNGFQPYQELLVGLLAEERERKKSIEQRGLSVVTSSGTLATLLFALAVLVTGSKGFQLPGSSRQLLVASVTFSRPPACWESSRTSHCSMRKPLLIG